MTSADTEVGVEMFWYAGKEWVTLLLSLLSISIESR